VKIKKIIFTLSAWVIVLIIINFLSGFVAKNTYVHLDPVTRKTENTTYGYFLPNQQKTLLFPGLKPYTVKTDSYGFRWTGLDSMKAKKNAYRILCIGDSMTFGLFVDDKDSYPYRLASLIRSKKKNTAIFNGGVGGAMVSDCFYYLKRKGLSLKPDIVVMNFCTNDLDEIKRALPLYQEMLSSSRLSIFEKIKLTKFMRMFRKLEIAYKYQRYLNKIKDKRVQEILKEQKKDLEDVLYVEAYHVGDKVLDPYNEKLKPTWEAYLKELDKLVGLLNDNKVRFIYVIHPNILTVFDETNGYYQDILIKFLKKKNVEYIDLRPVFAKKRDEYLLIYNNPPRDYHLSGYGNQILAREIYSRI